MKQIDEQRYLWLFRAFGLFFVISIILNIVLLIAFSKISPDAKRELFFISSENEDIENIYITKSNNQDFPISQDSIGYEIAKSYISEYIIDRESLFSDRVKMSNIFGLDGNIYFLSSKIVYEKFLKSEEYSNALLNKKKEVKVVNIEKLDYQPNSKKWIAEISVKTINSLGINPEIIMKKIAITCDFSTKSTVKSAKGKWKNPLNFEITNYEYLKN